MLINILKKTYKLYKKEGNKKKNSQRIDLLGRVYKHLIRGNLQKTIKILNEDFSEDNIEPSNKSLYDFLYFTAYNKLNDKNNAKIWYEKLKTNEAYKTLLLKSRKI